MCKKSIYKKNFLLCTIAGTLIFSHCGSTYANTQAPIMVMARADKAGEEKTFNNVVVRGRFTTVVADEKSFITIKNSTLRSDSTLISASQAARVHAKKIVGKAGTRGLEIANGTIHVEDSVITVSGHHKSYGIRFDHIPDSYVKQGENVVNRAILTNTKLLITDGIGIAGPYSSKTVAEVYLKNSEIRSEMLLKNKNVREDNKPKTLTLTADNSAIEGKVRTFPKNTTIFNLNNGSKWFLKVSQFEVGDSNDTGEPISYKLLDIKQRAESVVSVLNLNNSSIVFHTPHALAKEQYQTLHIGKHPQTEEPTSQEGKTPTTTNVYNATGHANIYFNIEWSDGLPIQQQKADHLLVHGDVSGSTIIHVNNLAESEMLEAEDSIPLNERGLSLIQVSGKTDENAFKLANGYTTMAGLPYKYTLNAYGPTSRHGKADSAQNLLGSVSQESERNAANNKTKHVVLGGVVVEIERSMQDKATPSHGKAANAQSPLRENKDFWDFRLQKETLDDEGKVLALVPQVASYLSMPNALFSAGFADVNNQNTLISNMRTTALEAKDHKNRGVFLSTYGNKMTLSSHRAPLQYGYGADLHYAALQAGVTLATLEDQNITTNFGLLGTYGRLAFTPKDIEGADKTMLDKWSLTAYGNLNHDNGLSINALFSYGTLKGDIKTALRGKTAELSNKNTLSASATIGQRLVTSAPGLVFEPQAQLVYQHLMLGTLKDMDNFEVNMGKHHQWLVRIGGRLTQTTLPAAKDRAVSFYGKVNVMKTFADKSTIQIGDTFHLDDMGASLEGGLGVNAQLSQNIALHADVNYQHKLQKAGISGINVSGGMHYRF